jgi:hypothetical protein
MQLCRRGNEAVCEASGLRAAGWMKITQRGTSGTASLINQERCCASWLLRIRIFDAWNSESWNVGMNHENFGIFLQCRISLQFSCSMTSMKLLGIFEVRRTLPHGIKMLGGILINLESWPLGRPILWNSEFSEFSKEVGIRNSGIMQFQGCFWVSHQSLLDHRHLSSRTRWLSPPPAVISQS